MIQEVQMRRGCPTGLKSIGQKVLQTRMREWNRDYEKPGAALDL
jgi:hypothetical protein